MTISTNRDSYFSAKVFVFLSVFLFYSLDTTQSDPKVICYKLPKDLLKDKTVVDFEEY